MFKIIFLYELKQWLRQPSLIIYLIIFFALAVLSMSGKAGLWDEPGLLTATPRLANAPASIYEMFIFFNKLLLLLLPAIVGLSIYRDYRYRVHSLLYSYPITKPAYLWAKFLSGMLIVVGLGATVGLGLFIGTQLPGVDPQLIGTLRPLAYVQSYGLSVLPNLCILGAIIFAVVTFSRNIYAGFVAIVLLLFFQGFLNGLSIDADWHNWLALLDPIGERAALSPIAYWSTDVYNDTLVPVDRLFLGNRLLWLFLAGSCFVLLYRWFDFSRLPGSRQRGEKSTGQSRQQLAASQESVSEIGYTFSRSWQWQTGWQLALMDVRYIFRSWMFLSLVAAGLLLIAFQQAELDPAYGIRSLPTTANMLRIPALLYLGLVHIVTFLYAGLLMQRARVARMDALVDISPLPDRVFLLSKVGALVMMQIGLLSLLMLGGITVQLFQGYYDLHIDLYLFQLYGLYLPGLMIWTCAAVFVHSLFSNPYLGFFLLVLAAVGVMTLPELGIEAYVFRYGAAPDFNYSDLEGFGSTLGPHFLYKAYWMLLALALLTASYLLMQRGPLLSWREHLTLTASRFRGRPAGILSLLLVSFLSLGSGLYYAEYLASDQITSRQEEEQWRAEYEKRYKDFEQQAQPKITAVELAIDIYPATQDFRCKGTYVLINRSAQPIDSLLVNYSYDEKTTYRFDQTSTLLSRDTIHRFDIHRLEQSLAPGDSLLMTFQIENVPNTFFAKNNLIRRNGTYFTDEFLPGLGYRPLELTDPAKRAKYGLSPMASSLPYPEDSTARRRSYSSRDADRIAFTATLSTSADQIAIAPGELIREWTSERRRYFHYQMQEPIKDYFGFSSGRYECRKEQWRGIDLEIYHHPSHTYNLDHMMQAMQDGLDYCSSQFAPYPHGQARIIEFPATVGHFATTFATSIPFSERFFLLDIDEQHPTAINLPYYVTAHEIAHQWWGNQIVPADALGAGMLTESLAEYTALKILEKRYGAQMLHRFLQMDLDLYRSGRAQDLQKEVPLIHARKQQQYLTYRKGALALYALSEQVGEEVLNKALQTFIAEWQLQYPPYPTSIDLVAHLRAALPDSSHNLMRDLFETVDLSDEYFDSLVRLLPKSGYGGYH